MKAGMLIRPTVKGQIVIPVALRRKHGITENTPIYVYEEDGKIILEPITSDYINKVRGMFKDVPLMETIKQMRAEDERKEEQRLQQWHKEKSSTPQS